jgi:hypothetical protein
MSLERRQRRAKEEKMDCGTTEGMTMRQSQAQLRGEDKWFCWCSLMASVLITVQMK